MDRKKNEIAQQSLLDWFKSRDKPNARKVAVTLTFAVGKRGMGPTLRVARGTVRHYLRKLNQLVFGKAYRRYRRRLEVIAVIEGGAPSHKPLHYHLQITVPDGRHLEAIRSACIAVWKTVPWASRDHNVAIESDEGWMGYMLKPRDKPDFLDAIDWLNTYIAPVEIPRL